MSITSSIKVRSAGGSLIVTIPKPLVDQEQLRPGDEVEITLRRRRTGGLEAMYGLAPELPEWDRSWTRGRDRY